MTQSFTPPKGTPSEVESLTAALVHKRQVISEAKDSALKTDKSDEKK